MSKAIDYLKNEIKTKKENIIDDCSSLKEYSELFAEAIKKNDEKTIGFALGEIKEKYHSILYDFGYVSNLEIDIEEIEKEGRK